MTRLKIVILALAALAFGVILVTGVDLINGRTGGGLMLLGLTGCALSLWLLISPGSDCRLGLVSALMAGGGYFVWRALSGGPESLAIADVALIVLGLGVYLGVAASGQAGRRIWMGILVGVALLNAGIAIYQKLGSGVYYFWHDRTGEKQMIVGLFGHRNVFAAFLNGTIFFLLSYLFLGKKKWLRVFFAVLGSAMVLALVFSGSRGGWLSFVVGGAVWMAFLILYLKQRGSRMVGLAALLAVVLVVVGGVTSVSVVKEMTKERRVEQNPEQEDVELNLADTDGGRFAFQQMAFEVFQDEPVIGQGARAFSYRSLEKWDPDALALWTNLPAFAHNEYLQTLSDYGLVGFMILVGLFFAHALCGLLGILKSDRESEGLSIWQLGALGGLAAVLCQSFFSFLFHFPALVALVALQLGILASVSRQRAMEAQRGVAVFGRCAGLMGAVVSVGLFVLGLPLMQSYLLDREGAKQLSTAETKEEILRAFDTLEEAAEKGRDPDILKTVARRAMAYANAAAQKGQPDLARDFNLRAKGALERALELNPYLGEAIVGMPRINEALGNYEEADKGHEKAMRALWVRENSLKPHFHAARSSFNKAFRTEHDGEALRALYESRKRLDRRIEIFRRTWDYQEVRLFRADLEAWIAFYEGRQLFIKGDDVWKNARPRNPELAYALLLEAQKRYKKSGKVVLGKDPRWQMDSKQLETHVKFLKMGQIEPATLSEEEIRKVVLGDAGLASDESSR